jgi:hypothetical protein
MQAPDSGWVVHCLNKKCRTISPAAGSDESSLSPRYNRDQETITSLNPHQSPQYIRTHAESEENGPDRKPQDRHFQNYMCLPGQEISPPFFKYLIPAFSNKYGITVSPFPLPQRKQAHLLTYFSTSFAMREGVQNEYLFIVLSRHPHIYIQDLFA